MADENSIFFKLKNIITQLQINYQLNMEEAINCANVIEIKLSAEIINFNNKIDNINSEHFTKCLDEIKFFKKNLLDLSESNKDEFNKFLNLLNSKFDTFNQINLDIEEVYQDMSCLASIFFNIMLYTTKLTTFNDLNEIFTKIISTDETMLINLKQFVEDFKILNTNILETQHLDLNLNQGAGPIDKTNWPLYWNTYIKLLNTSSGAINFLTNSAVSNN